MSQLEIDIRFWYTAIKVRMMMFIVEHFPLSPENWGTLMAKSLCGIEYMIWLAELEKEL